MATSKAPEKASDPQVEIPMESPDGRPWIAQSEVEAFELQTGHGYKRLDGGPDSPPALSATAKDGAADPTGKTGTSAGTSAGKAGSST